VTAAYSVAYLCRQSDDSLSSVAAAVTSACLGGVGGQEVV